MAIGRVAGPLLYSNLDRQGIDLQFTTDSSPLLYLDFANFRAAINANTYGKNETFTVNGNVMLSNIKVDNTTISSATDIHLSAAGNVTLGNITGLKITGGTLNYVMTTDGAGNLAWQNIGDVADELNLTGMDIILGTPTDTSLVTNSAYRYWTANTEVTNAIDNLNQVMLNVHQNTYVGVVDFTSNVLYGPSPLTVSFTSTHNGNPNTYEWEFRNSSNVVVDTSNVQHPVYTFNNTAGGTYSVYFKASNSAGTLGGAGSFGDPMQAQGSYADKLKVGYITLFTPAPIPTFELSAYSINDQTSVTFVNHSLWASSYTIHWGDGATSTVASNFVNGGPDGPPIAHTYTNVSGDALCPVTLDAFSPTAGPSGLTVTSAATNVKVYSGHAPAFTANVTTGNNQHATIPNGLVVGFTNTTATGPGATSTFSTNQLRYNWGDGTSSNVAIGSGSAGDLGLTLAHAYTLTNPTVQQVFTANLQIFNGNTTSPFTSANTLVTVKPAPTALFTGNAAVISDKTGDTAQTGYLFTDLSGNNRARIDFTNQSYNTDSYSWDFGDALTAGPLVEGVEGTPTGTALAHTYTSTGTYTVTALSTGSNSLNGSDDTLVKTNYIRILAAPSPPAGLGTKTLTLNGTTGTTPLLVALATDNSGGSIPSQGNAVNRITVTNPVETNTVANVYNAYTGTLTAKINNVSEAPVTLTGGNDVGTTGSLAITEDKDAHVVDPATYPTNFYNVFSGKVSKSNASVAVGYNTYQMVHSATGNTNLLGFVKDDVVLVPTLDTTLATITTTTPGTLRYVSGVPYFNTGATIAIHGVNAYNWIGQTYLGSVTPMTVAPGTIVSGTGNGIVLQGKSYAELDGSPTFLSSGVPKANTGKNSGVAYTLGAIPVTINGTAASSSKISMTLSNVNGASTTVELSTPINVYSSAISGLDELSIPVSLSLGGTFTDNGKRIAMPSASGSTPAFNSATNYYVTYPFSGVITIAGTDEAVTRFGVAVNDTTNYSLYQPAGPDLSGRSGTQYFRFAWRRSQVANFTLTYSGKISGLWIAAPASAIDTASTLNGWVDATLVYAGAGVPGANTGAGGNGSNGCAKSAGDVIVVGATVSNSAHILTLGSANSSDATGDVILVCIALASGDSLTAVSIS
jgi:PKD repeat protein